jgi:hypothetical protein
MRVSIWRRLRRWWHQALKGLSREAAEDLIDGLDLADHDCGGFADVPRFPLHHPNRGKREGWHDNDRIIEARRRLPELEARMRAGDQVLDVIARGVALDLATRERFLLRVGHIEVDLGIELALAASRSWPEATTLAACERALRRLREASKAAERGEVHHAD